VQHQLRAFTPDYAKALRATVSTYPNSGYDLEEVLTTRGTGEAIVTVMNERCAPSPVAWTRLRASQGSMSPTADAEIDSSVAAPPLLARYGTAIDRDSGREMLAAKLEAAHSAAVAAEAAEQAQLDRVKAAADLEKRQDEMAEQQARADKKAQAEYDRLMKRTQGTPEVTRRRRGLGQL
jgi:hypothetical protein